MSLLVRVTNNHNENDNEKLIKKISKKIRHKCREPDVERNTIILNTKNVLVRYLYVVSYT